MCLEITSTKKKRDQNQKIKSRLKQKHKFQHSAQNQIYTKQKYDIRATNKTILSNEPV